MNQSTTTFSDRIARGIISPPGSAIDIILILKIIEILLPIIIDCFDPDDGAQAQEYVTKRWNGSSYDKRLVKAVTRRAKQAARQEGNRITWDVAQGIAISTLNEIRTSNVAELNEIIMQR